MGLTLRMLCCFLRTYVCYLFHINTSSIMHIFPLVAHMVKNLPIMQETWVYLRVGKIPWRREGLFSSILAWRTPWTEESGRLQSMGSQRVRHN